MMLATAIIAFREFLEVFLIIGLFLGVSRKLKLRREKEIVFAGLSGILFSFLLITITYVFGDYASKILTEQNADALESYLLIFSGVFLVYVVFSLHKVMNRKSHKVLTKTKGRMEREVFDISLFLTIVFLVIREGFEIALFTASTSLFATFIQNSIGLFVGFLGASLIGLLTSFAYVKLSLRRVFRITEYFIVILGASLFQNGVTTLMSTHFNISLSGIMSFHLNFLPGEHTFVGGLLQNFLGIDSGFSLMRLFIMVLYVYAVYLLFIKRPLETKEV